MADKSEPMSADESDPSGRSGAGSVSSASGDGDTAGSGTTRLGFRESISPLVDAGIVLGVGLGGFFDGIVLHQLLQVHHMVSARVAPTDLAGMELNVVADGLFHAATYLFTIAGIVLLYRAWRSPAVPASARALFGSVMMGFGLFNLVEGIVDHHLLVLHRVWPAGPGPPLLWDLLFLLSGLLLLVGGYAIVRSDDAAAAKR